MKIRRMLSLVVALVMVLAFIPAMGVQAEEITPQWTVYKYNKLTASAQDAGDKEGAMKYFVAYGSGGMDYMVSGETYNSTSKDAYVNSRIATVTFESPTIEEGDKVFLYVTGANRTTFGNKSASNWQRLVVSDAVSSGYDKSKFKYDASVSYFANEVGEKNANPVKRTSKIDITDFVTEGTTTVYLGCPVGGSLIENLKISVEKPVYVTATYKLNGETFKTVEKSYNPALEDGATFSSLVYAENGLNAIYSAEETVLAESGDIQMTALANAGTHAIGDTVAVNGVQYEIKSNNLVPNADFAYGTLGWFGGDGNQSGATVSDGAITLSNKGFADNKSLNQSWAIEEGKTYLYTYTTVTGDGNAWRITSLQNQLKADENTTDAPVLVGTTNNSEHIGTLAAMDSGGVNNYVFTNTEGYAYLQSAFRWTGATFKDFGLYEIEEAKEVAKEEIEEIAAPAEIKVFGNDAVVLPNTVEVTGSFGTVVDGAVVWNEPDTYDAGTNTVDGTVTVQFGTQDAIESTVTVNVTIIDEFTLPDTESYGAQPGHQVAFPVQINGGFTMEFDYTINQIVDSSIQLGGNVGKLFGNGALGISPNKGVLNATGGDKAGTSEGVKLLDVVKVGETYHMILQMDASSDTYTLYVELADGTVVSTGEKGFRKAQEYIDIMTVLVNGGDINKKNDLVISNITVNTNPVELCTVWVDGAEKKVIKGHSYKAQLAGAIFDDAGVMYASENDVIEVLVENDMTLTTKALGLEIVNGAQVRIGSTRLGADEKLNAMADSGIRFLATADYNDTLLEEAEEFGIKVTAEESENVVYVKADKFQDDANSIFSAAITNLKESNYNRRYTASVYAKVNGVEITTGEVTRSIYQVSAGIMKNGRADAEDAAYTIEGIVKNVLNAYVNQTGIRLGYNGTEMTVEEGKYTGDVFFTVESSAIEGGVRVTITPDTTWGTPASIATWWTDYVRVNNNNSVAKTCIENPQFVDGVLTFDFMYTGK